MRMVGLLVGCGLCCGLQGEQGEEGGFERVFQQVGAEAEQAVRRHEQAAEGQRAPGRQPVAAEALHNCAHRGRAPCVLLTPALDLSSNEQPAAAKGRRKREAGEQGGRAAATAAGRRPPLQGGSRTFALRSNICKLHCAPLGRPCERASKRAQTPTRKGSPPALAVNSPTQLHCLLHPVLRPRATRALQSGTARAPSCSCGPGCRLIIGGSKPNC